MNTSIPGGGKKRGPKPRGGPGTPVFVRMDSRIIAQLDAYRERPGWTRARAVRYIVKAFMQSRFPEEEPLLPEKRPGDRTAVSYKTTQVESS